MGVGLCFFFAYVDFFFRFVLTGRAGSYPHRARWMRFWAVGFLRALNFRINISGPLPEQGIVVSNHLTYMDIVVLGSLRPLVFLSKSEVASWPVIGVLTRCAGTLYINRQKKSDVARLGGALVKVVESGVPVTMFLEGTSSDGSEVLPFRSSLLAPLENHTWRVTPTWIHYECADGSVAEEVCYWRDMTFFPHLLNLMSKQCVEAFVCFGTPMPEIPDRKEMARQLHSRVCELKQNWERANGKVPVAKAGSEVSENNHGQAVGTRVD